MDVRERSEYKGAEAIYWLLVDVSRTGRLTGAWACGRGVTTRSLAVTANSECRR